MKTNHTEGMKMAQYQITIDEELLHQLCSRDDALVGLLPLIPFYTILPDVTLDLGPSH